VRRREYTGPLALQAMQSLAARVSPVTGYRMIGDLAWNWCLQHDRPSECPTAVWNDNSEVVAWGWLELPDALMLQVDPAHPDLAEEVLDWAEGKAGGGLSVEVCQTETVLIAELQRRGYRAEEGPFMVCMARSLADLHQVPRLPRGYVIRQPSSQADVERRAAAHRAAFDSIRVTGQRHARMMEIWPYRPEFDLVVEGPDGVFAAYCQGWYDAVNRTGEFEPVGTRPGYRRLGLAKAVCTAVLHAFAAAGAERAVVYARGDAAYPAPKMLYESIGFEANSRTVTYSRPRGLTPN
jgi:ribosomal protein S18 acetylase RimI-like enzyme